MLQFAPSTIAASAVYMCIKVFADDAETPIWPAELEEFTNLTEAALRPCVAEICQLVKAASSHNDEFAVYRKYHNTRNKGPFDKANLCLLTAPRFEFIRVMSVLGVTKEKIKKLGKKR